jgi:hypothetical protein
MNNMEIKDRYPKTWEKIKAWMKPSFDTFLSTLTSNIGVDSSKVDDSLLDRYLK